MRNFITLPVKAALLFLLACPTADEVRPFAVVWNIGQGQWVTVVTNSSCLHFDMGGEHSLPPVLRYCSTRLNRVYLSHGDLDHIKFLSWGALHLPHLCDAAPPQDKISSAKQKLVNSVPLCRDDIATNEVRVTEITPPQLGGAVGGRGGHNELSRVFVVTGPSTSILIPGDSTAEAEEVWSRALHSVAGPPVSILVAGHHGSRTSTSEVLLRALPSLRVAVASARRVRYGHPHIEVVARLHSHHVPILSTEVWGSVILRL